MKSYKKKIVYGITILFFITMLFPAFEAHFVESLDNSEYNMSNNVFTHTVLGEEASATWCVHCPPVMTILNNIYNSGQYDFYYVALVADMNSYANSRCGELGVTGYPTVAYDGGYMKLVGDALTQTDHENAINNCGARTVANINLNLHAYWLGSGQIRVKIGVTNNGGSTYNGHIHAYVTEINSRWYNQYGPQYHFAMINNYAINQNVDVSAGATKYVVATWNGYSDITMSNIKVIASAFSQSTKYTDETAAVNPEYPNSNPPQTPSQPSGPNTGVVGIINTYSTSSTEPNGDLIKYGWDWDGDNTVDDWTDYYPSGQTVSIDHFWTSPGTYNVKVKAKDEFDTESSFSPTKQVQITIGEPPNTPSTPSGQDNGMHKTSYTYSTSTTDPNPGDKLYYKFDWDDGTTSQWMGPYDSGQTISTDHVWNEPGTFNVKVKAKDLAESESDWSNAKTVVMGNTPPNKPQKPSGPTSGAVGTKYKFTTSTTDPENDNLEYYFTWGDDTNSGWVPTKYAEHIWLKSGDFGVRVKARDKWAESEWSSFTSISIESGSLIVNIEAEPENAIVDEEIQFSATVSGGKSPYTYNWDFGDGNTSSEQNPIYAYEKTGNFIVSLSVEDGSGAYGSNYTTINIEITNPPEKPIIVDGLESALINQPCNFTFTTTDPNEDNVYILVDWGDNSETTWEGPFESGDDDMVLYHTWENDGAYTVKAKAKDTYDYESEWSEEFQITVGWQDAFIIGKISGKEEKENTTEITVESVMYLSFNPFSIKFYNSDEVIVISNDSKGLIGNNFVLGKFKTGYI